MFKVDIKKSLAEKADLINGRIDSILSQWTGIPARLADAVKYVLAAPGKRIRAAIVLWCCELVSGKVNDDALNAAAAIEMVHTYSLFTTIYLRWTMMISAGADPAVIRLLTKPRLFWPAMRF